MITIKFNTDKGKEIVEYIKMKMTEIMNKHQKQGLLNEECKIEWNSFYYSIYGEYIEICGLKFQNLQGSEILPNTEFIKFISEGIITSDTWTFVEWCLRGVEEYIDNLYKIAKENEEKIQKDLENNNAYLEYKSMKVIKKLESE
ncbi:MAG: hypothetical protein QW156_04990 [Candidatus Aenigmatarchaeota archaeon]